MKKTTKETVLVLRTCSANMTSSGGFRWPKRGPVSAPDWVDNYECGNGLHGWLWGEGDGTLGHVDTPKAKWLVVRVIASEVRHGAGHLIGKCKFPRGYVVHCGDRKSATEYIVKHGANGKAVIGSTVTAGHYGTATAGDYGTATAGDYGTATAGYKGTATTGDSGTATAGHGGTATAGDYGTATAGDYGTATAGDYGTATAGRGGTATAGHGGTICIQYYDMQNNRYRLAVAYVGENGIMPNRKYALNDSHEFVEVK